MLGQGARNRAGSTMRRVQRLQGFPPAGRILGLDPGLHITGYGVIEMPMPESPTEARARMHGGTVGRTSNRDPKLIDGGVLRAKPTDPLPLRLQTLYDAVRQVLDEHRPDVVVIEELFSTYAHPRSALLMAHARGALMLAAQQSGARVHSFLPNEVKQVLTGNGHAPKAAMQAAVKARLHLAAPPSPPDVADALAIALCFAVRQGTGDQFA
ncbi:MAG TPA: crossover junction endodeoxyribonuclease RuvC [Abditibacteriaceae bacterium]